MHLVNPSLEWIEWMQHRSLDLLHNKGCTIHQRLLCPVPNLINQVARVTRRVTVVKTQVTKMMATPNLKDTPLRKGLIFTDPIMLLNPLAAAGLFPRQFHIQPPHPIKHLHHSTIPSLDRLHQLQHMHQRIPTTVVVRTPRCTHFLNCLLLSLLSQTNVI